MLNDKFIKLISVRENIVALQFLEMATLVLDATGDDVSPDIEEVYGKIANVQDANIFINFIIEPVNLLAILAVGMFLVCKRGVLNVQFFVLVQIILLFFVYVLSLMFNTSEFMCIKASD